jgi:hypothetical protein
MMVLIGSLSIGQHMCAAWAKPVNTMKVGSPARYSRGGRLEDRAKLSTLSAVEFSGLIFQAPRKRNGLAHCHL